MAEKKVKSKEDEKVENKKVSKMYLGPSIKKYGINSGSVYQGEFPSNVKKAIEEYPEIKELFVEIDNNFYKNKGNINKTGTRENIFLKKLMKKLGGDN